MSRRGVGRRFPRRLTNATLAEAARLLADRDPNLAGIFRRLGVPPTWGRRPGFAALVLIILEQQVSLASARAMYRRLNGHLDQVTPEGIYSTGEAGLRDLGLTRQKAGYVHGLAGLLLEGTLDLASVARGPDDAGRQALLSVRGLGPWSVDIYYLMALRRPDIWPTGDLALPDALRAVKRLDHLPSHEEQLAIADTWRPWRSVAARLLWSHYLAARGQYVP